MKHYGLLDDIVTSLKSLFKSRRLLIGAIPLVIGMLSVPGGAYLSAPFVDDLGKDMNIAPEKRAVINLTFRHIAMLINPFSTPLLYIAASVPDLSIYKLILLNIPLALVIMAGSVKLYMPGPRSFTDDKPNEYSKRENIRRLLLGISPIVIAILFNGILRIPMSAAIAISILWVWIICPKKDFIDAIRKGLNFDLPVMILVVFFIQNTILQMTDIMDTFKIMFESPSTIVILLALLLGCFFIGTVTGLNLAVLGVFIPIILSLPLTTSELWLFVFFLNIWSFLGYYYSPLHLCQILTIKYIDVPTLSVYKQHIKLFPWLAAVSFILYYLYSLLL